MAKTVKTPSSEAVHLKTNFECDWKIEPFFNGSSGISVSSHLLASACDSGVKVLDLNSGKTVHNITEDEDSVASLALSGDRSYLAVGWRSVLVKLYSLSDDVKLQRSWKAHNGPSVSMAIDKTNSLLATGSTDSGVKVWDMLRGYCTHNLRGSGGVVLKLLFHPDKLQLFSVSSDNAIRVWDLTTSKCVSVLRGHVSAVTSLAVSGDVLLSGGRDQVILTWSLESGAVTHTTPVFEAVEGVVLLPGELLPDSPGLLFASAGEKGVIKLWSSVSDKALTSLAPVAGGYCWLGFEDGALVAATHNQAILVYDPRNNFTNTKQLLGYLDEVLDLSPVGADHLAVATNSEQVKLYNTTTGSSQLLSGHSEIVLCLDVAGDTLVTGSRDNTIRVWSVIGDSASCVGLGTGHTHYVGAVSIAKSKRAFVVSGSQDCTLKVWSVKNLASQPTQLTVKYTQHAHDKDINSVDVSPNDRLIVSASQDKTAKLWKAKDGSLLGTLRGHRRGVWCARFSPVDQCVATASGDSMVKLWSLSDYSCVKTFEGHTNSVLKLAFLSRGMQLASSGSDGLVKVWTIRSNECVATLDGHTERVWALAVSHDSHLISGGADSTINYWKDVTESVVLANTEKAEELLLRQQELSNLLQAKEYSKAVGVALSLEQPMRLLGLLKDLLSDGGSVFEETLHSLTPDQLTPLLRYCSRWNQNSRHCYVSQSVLAVLLGNPETLISLDDASEHIKALIPYTERHLQRLDRLKEMSMFVEYSLMKMAGISEIPIADHVTPDVASNALLDMSENMDLAHALDHVTCHVTSAPADSTTTDLLLDECAVSPEASVKKSSKRKARLKRLKKTLLNRAKRTTV